MFRKYCAETIGTFALVFAGTGAVIVNTMTGELTHVGVSLVFGLVVMAVIYAIGDVSGAHINPAVTLGFAVAGRFPLREIPGYLLAQSLGAILASGCLKLLFFDQTTLGETMPAGGEVLRAFWLEVLLTLLLMFVILCVSTGAKEKGIMAGAAIGGVIAFEALLGGPISGASMNPARSLAPAVVAGRLTHQWVYLIAPTLGAIASVPIFRTVWSRADEDRDSPSDG